jgi:tetratricopeptide (TPR) repeat protein
MSFTENIRKRPPEQYPETTPDPKKLRQGFERFTPGSQDPSVLTIEYLRMRIPVPSSAETATSNSYAPHSKEKSELEQTLVNLLGQFKKFVPDPSNLRQRFYHSKTTETKSQPVTVDSAPQLNLAGFKYQDANKRDTESTPHFKQGEDFFYKKQYDDAINSLMQVKETAPEFYDAQYFIGYSFYKKGEYQNAPFFLKQIKKEHRNYELSQEYLGHCYYGLKDYSSASKHYDLLTVENPNYMYARFLSGICYYNEYQYSEAIERLNDVQYTSPYYFQARLLSGKCCMAMGSYVLAIRLLEKV